MAKTGPYTKKVIECFRNPKNYGKMKNPDGIGKVGNPVCGDVMWLYIKVEKDKKGREILGDIKFETFGCVAAIATSSVITDLAMGKTLETALKIDKTKIVNSLGGLPPIKLHCSVLAAEALSEAVYDYLKKKGREISEELQERHKRAEATRRGIEEKYKDWTDIEEKAHKKRK
ncbi:MAG: iron-sulfur cluster assembly scaffold protein [Patescibacteria group bacterium]